MEQSAPSFTLPLLPLSRSSVGRCVRASGFRRDAKRENEEMDDECVKLARGGCLSIGRAAEEEEVKKEEEEEDVSCLFPIYCETVV